MKIEKDLITGIVYSRFHATWGPKAVAWLPDELELNVREYISLKSINILVGEQESLPKALAIIPFPTIDLKGLIRCFEIEDPRARGGLVDNALTLLFNEKHDPIFYKYIDNFEPIFEEAVQKIRNIPEKNINEIKNELKKFQDDLNIILNELQDSEISMQQLESFPVSEEDKEALIEYRFKVIVCGDPQVGKTSTILRFTDKAFRRSYIPTIGVNISEKQMRLKEKTLLNFTIWDIAGQSKFQVARKHFYKGARGQIIVFDLTRPETFNNVVKWVEDIKRHLNTKITGILLGNKADLMDQKKVSLEEISRLEDELKLKYFETSALTGVNVDKAFNYLGESLRKEK